MAEENQSTKASEVYSHVASRIYKLENAEPGETKAKLAVLRRAAGKKLQDVPEVWGMILEEMPESLFGRWGGPSASEEAVFLALTLYGLAMQGHDAKTDSMQEKSISLGEAAGLYTKTVGEENSRILPRFRKVIVSDSPEAMQVPLRSIIQLLSQKKIKMDYAKLAKDLYNYHFSKGRENVRLHWARDYYKSLRPDKKEENQTKMGHSDTDAL